MSSSTSLLTPDPPPHRHLSSPSVFPVVLSTPREQRTCQFPSAVPLVRGTVPGTRWGRHERAGEGPENEPRRSGCPKGLWICHVPARSAGEWASRVSPAGPAEPASARPQPHKGSCLSPRGAPEEGPDLWREAQGREDAGLLGAGPLRTPPWPPSPGHPHQDEGPDVLQSPSLTLFWP